MSKAKPYLDLLEKHREELSNFPIAYAFDEKQVEQALKKLGATREEVVTVFGHGDIVKKEDAPKFLQMLKRHADEIRELIKDKDIAYGAFLYEMDNHEYCINYDGDGDVLGCFGLNFEQLKEMDLEVAYQLARREHMRKAHEEWEII